MPVEPDTRYVGYVGELCESKTFELCINFIYFLLASKDVFLLGFSDILSGPRAQEFSFPLVARRNG